MSFDKRFCSSPWIHQRITNDGTFVPCRWQKTKYDSNRKDINTITPEQHFQDEMHQLRVDMINGEYIDECQPCYDMEKHGKVSGRLRQLLKTGIEVETLNNDVQTSPFYKEFQKTADGIKTNQLPIDIQVDLGNYCNGQCVFCHPVSSSSLATEFFKIGLLDQKLDKPWTRYPELLDKFVDSVVSTPNVAYIHFIGGETIIDPAFKYILKKFIKHNATNVTLGFTTNLTVWDDEINELLLQFKQISLGLSIESLEPINDYARYPSKQDKTKELLDSYVKLGKDNDWLIQLRMTPTWMTIESLHTVFEYAMENKVSVQSCNFLYQPKFMKMSILPKELRQLAINNLTNWINKYDFNNSRMINTRNMKHVEKAIVQDAVSYLEYLKKEEYETHLTNELVEYLKKLESSRQNSILDYMPHYEEFLRSYGY